MFTATLMATKIITSSFLYLRGRCGHCRSRISMIYPASEIITGLSFWGVYTFNTGGEAALVLKLLIISVLVFIALYDFKYFLILDLSVVIGVLLVALLSYLSRSLLVDLVSGLA